MIFLEKLLNILFFAAAAFALITVILIFQANGDINKLPSFFGYKPLTVLSNSMLPTFEAGDIIIINTNQSPEINHVITYTDQNGKLTSHRIIEVDKKQGLNRYITKGDYNNNPDQGFITDENIIGVKSFVIPKLGYIANGIAGVKGMFFLIILPLVFVAIIEIFKRLNVRES